MSLTTTPSAQSSIAIVDNLCVRLMIVHIIPYYVRKIQNIYCTYILYHIICERYKIYTVMYSYCVPFRRAPPPQNATVPNVAIPLHSEGRSIMVTLGAFTISHHVLDLPSHVKNQTLKRSPIGLISE